MNDDDLAKAAKARENKLRRMAKNQNRLLVKSHLRDEYAIGYGLYVLVEDKAGNRRGPGRRYGGQAAVTAFASGHGMTLDDIERVLTGEVSK